MELIAATILISGALNILTAVLLFKSRQKGYDLPVQIQELQNLGQANFDPATADVIAKTATKAVLRDAENSPTYLTTNSKFTPLHTHCPKCGCDLSKEPVNTSAQKTQSDQIKNTTSNTESSRVAGDDTGRMKCSCGQESSLQRVINPLTKTEQEDTQRNQQRRHSRQHRKNTSGSKQKNEHAYNH